MALTSIDDVNVALYSIDPLCFQQFHKKAHSSLRVADQQINQLFPRLSLISSSIKSAGVHSCLAGRMKSCTCCFLSVSITVVVGMRDLYVPMHLKTLPLGCSAYSTLSKDQYNNTCSYEFFVQFVPES